MSDYEEAVKKGQRMIYSTVTVGALLRFLNAECRNAGKNNQSSKAYELAQLAEQVEDALQLYEDRYNIWIQ